ncbi:UxaA family hydrolase|uniref:UxaA family hydrolase n=1 Tax=Noviherbaspirillum sp. L7-7A TaxID=2850560 RepID=UPI001C2C4351|nr:UxaA family hydrolase [Noviherbaspirillum sp. L7-7A]MBV0877719.1 UxaA family hydrolase [Noviherbaspirillum sp. L7-7A]
MGARGYDPVAATSGVNLICFTNARAGSQGCTHLPRLKLVTDTTLFGRIKINMQMNMDMDFNCGGIIGGELGIAEAGRQLFDLVLAAASGRRGKSEKHGMGDNAFLPRQIGAVM